METLISGVGRRFTLRGAASTEGLELLDRDGTWLPVHGSRNSIVVDAGDMLARITNNVISATTHRVVNPKGEGAHQSRYSMPFFVHPDPDMSLACLPQCCSQDRPKQYPDILAGEYHQQRLKEIGF